MQSPRLHCNLDAPWKAWSLHIHVLLVAIAVYVNDTILGYGLKKDATSFKNMGRFFFMLTGKRDSSRVPTSMITTSHTFAYLTEVNVRHYDIASETYSLYCSTNSVCEKKTNSKFGGSCTLTISWTVYFTLHLKMHLPSYRKQLSLPMIWIGDPLEKQHPKFKKPQTRFDWLILALYWAILSFQLDVEPYSPIGPDNVKITLYRCMGRHFTAATRRNDSCRDV